MRYRVSLLVAAFVKLSRINSCFLLPKFVAVLMVGLQMETCWLLSVLRMANAIVCNTKDRTHTTMTISGASYLVGRFFEMVGIFSIFSFPILKQTC